MCNASSQHVPAPSRAACWHATVERSRALFKYHWYLWNVAAAINNRSLYFPYRECLFFISSGYRVATAAKAGIHSASPDQTSALLMPVTAASMCSRGSDARLKNTSSLVSVRLETVQASTSETSEGKDTLNLLTSRRSILEPAEP